MIPDSSHCVVIDQMSFFVDTATRKEIEHWIEHQECPLLTVDTLLGEELTIVRGTVSHLHSTSPETRKADRDMGKLFNDEKAPE